MSQPAFHFPQEGWDFPPFGDIYINNYYYVYKLKYRLSDFMPPAVFTLRANVFTILSYDCCPSFNACSKYLPSTGNVPTALQRLSHFIPTVTTAAL